jgi:hypothetical protein
VVEQLGGLSRVLCKIIRFDYAKCLLCEKCLFSYAHSFAANLKEKVRMADVN